MVTNANVTDPGMRIMFLLFVRNKLIVVADLSVHIYKLLVLAKVADFYEIPSMRF